MSLRIRSRRRPRGVVALVALVLLFASVSSAPAVDGSADDLLRSGQVRLEVRIEPERVLVGQRVDLVVEVFTQTWFTQAPRLPDTLPLPDAVVLPPETFGVNLNRRFDGEVYAGQRRTLTIFPTRGGQYQLPPVPVRLQIADPPSRPSVEITLRTPPLSFEARIPDAAQGRGLVIASPRLSGRQDWSSERTQLRVGDALTRTITWAVTQSPPMLLPELDFDAPAGVAVYAERPRLSQTRDRGAFQGERVDSVVYVFETEGRFVLPEHALDWWDVEASRLRTETLPGRELEILPSLDFAEVADAGTLVEGENRLPAQDAARRSRRPWGFAVLVLLALLLLASRRRWRSTRRTRRPDPAALERDAYASLRAASRSDQAAEFLAALYRWWDCHRAGNAPTLAALLQASDRPQLRCQLEALLRFVYGDGGTWSAEEILVAVDELRRSRGSRAHRGGWSALGPINPRGVIPEAEPGTR